MVTSSRKVDITTSLSLRYYIKVRPLIAGQAVAEPLATDVMSGSGGQKPVIYTFGPTQVDLKTYSGTIGTYNASVGGWNATEVFSPTASTVSGMLNSALRGEIITIENVDYIIDDVVGTSTPYILIIDQEQNYKTTGFDGKTFYIGVSKLAKELMTWTGPGFDFVINQIEVDQYAKPGANIYLTAPIIRVYPLAMESEADTVTLTSNGAVRYTVPTDILVTQNWGNRIVRIDAWDPSGQTDANKVGLTAAITISYRAVDPNEERSGLAR